MNDCAAASCSTVTWGVDDSGTRIPTEVLDTIPSSGSIELGPISAAPAVALDDASNLWVFAGTGRYYDALDETNSDQQYFVGVKDSVLNGACTESTKTGCHANDLVDVSSAEVCLIGTGDCGSGTNQVTGVTGASDFPSLISLVSSKDGWYTTLPTSGERVLSRPTVFGGLVLFPTFVPGGAGGNDPCGTSLGESFIYALYYLTGSAYSSPVVGTTSSGSNELVNRSTSVGAGMTSQAVVHMGHDSKFGKARAFVKKSTAEIMRIELTTTGGITSRRLSWVLLPQT